MHKALGLIFSTAKMKTKLNKEYKTKFIAWEYAP
jgi:hypothetical protein